MTVKSFTIEELRQYGSAIGGTTFVFERDYLEAAEELKKMRVALDEIGLYAADGLRREVHRDTLELIFHKVLLALETP